MAVFSSRGPTADGRLKPEVVAPGTNIVSVRSKHPKAKPEDSWGIYDDNYLYMGGTSMATPLTSGAMAVVRQYLVSKLGNSVSAAMLKATVANTAEDLFPGQFGTRASGQEQPTRRPNNHEGWGRVNLATLVADRTIALYDEHAGLATGQQKGYAVDVHAGQALRVTMSYTDAPGTASAARTLVNDLDVKVVDSAGHTYFPNGKSAKDDVNNTEEVDLLNAAPGSYQVIVSGANIPQGKNGAQPYALVISVR
jgi:subtilisin family serine protease